MSPSGKSCQKIIFSPMRDFYQKGLISLLVKSLFFPSPIPKQPIKAAAIDSK
jgi:hypothetical protein